MAIDDAVARFWHNLIGRLTGPMTFRLILQPTMAVFYAIRDGRRDARNGRPYYLFTMFRDRTARAELLHDGWRSLLRVLLLGAVMDVIYQYLMFRWVYPLELVVVVLLVVVLPYVLLRGPVSRLARDRFRR